LQVKEKIVLAYSGGVDTSVAIKWVPEHYKMDVITFTVDIGNVPDLAAIKRKAEMMGVKKAVPKKNLSGITAGRPCRPTRSTRGNIRWPRLWAGH
jgi:PP-loop superfamily ATP-utilizing enzyme